MSLGTITDDAILANLDDDLDYAFHLACYHGNQSSIRNPLADHDNNTLTSLKLFERLKDIASLQKVVYAAAGCAVAEKTYGQAQATKEDAPVSLFHDSPYSISKLIGEMYGNYYFTALQDAVCAGTLPERLWTGRDIGRRTVARHGTYGVAQRDADVRLEGAARTGELPVENGGIASRDFIYVDDIVRGLAACALRGRPGEAYNLATGVEVTIRDLAERVNALTDNETPIALKPARDWDRSGHRFGDPSKARDELGFTTSVDHRDGLRRTVEWTRENRDTILRCMLQHAELVPEVRAYA